MNKFITRNKPLTPKRPQKRPAISAVENALQNENSAPILEESIAKKTKKCADEPTIMEKLHTAIREGDARFTFDVLSKNRPFDHSMNKTMTKMEFASEYSATSSSSDFMLLSVDESVIDAFHVDQSLTIRGETTDDAVLCTETATFPIKMIESSSSMLLMHRVLEPPESPTEEPNFEVKMIDGKCFSTAELCPPLDVLNIGRLKDLLREQELRWDWKDREVEEKVKGYRLEELLDTVQMSRAEVKTALKDLPVVKFPSGKYRFLSHKFRGEMLGRIVEKIDDEAISIGELTFTRLRANLPENVPDDVIRWFLNSRCDTSSEGQFTLPTHNLIRDLAVVILFGTQKMPLQNFRELLFKILPFGVADDANSLETILEGVADISDAPFGKLISYLAPEDLPDTCKERMLYLFEHRKLWSMENLRPYFGDLYKSKVAFDKYVVQNCDYALSETNEMLYCGVRH
uniref:Sister chromatid cohesion protein DCC1 n=1 Tax=Caenorhabditis japonica TaxID=281687 RepID=A0A8R1HK61_CAEJA